MGGGGIGRSCFISTSTMYYSQSRVFESQRSNTDGQPKIQVAHENITRNPKLLKFSITKGSRWSPVSLVSTLVIYKPTMIITNHGIYSILEQEATTTALL